MRKTYHVTKTESGWQGIQEHESRPVVQGTTKREVVAQTIGIAKRNEPSSVRIHGVDGRIQEERTYPRSTDPHGSRG